MSKSKRQASRGKGRRSPSKKGNTNNYAKDCNKRSFGPDESESAVKDTESNNRFGGNSVEWYTRYPSLTAAAGSLPYPYKPGMLMPLGQVKESAAQTAPSDVVASLPGVLTFNWTPSVGRSSSQTSPISIVGKELYAKVREKFSGSIEADAPDFVIYLMALDSIFSYIASLKRLYRIINAYSPENYFTPNGLLASLGYTPAQVENLRENKIQLYQNINELVLMTRKFKCPRIMDIFNRHVWLNDHVYTDAPTIKSQFYMFAQQYFYKFTMLNVVDQPTVQAGGLQVAAPTIEGNSNVVGQLFTFGRSLIDALAASDDGYLISGYLMRAYEGFPDFYVDELLLGETLIPKYNEEVLGEIENLHTLPAGLLSISLNITQNPATNAIISDPIAQYDRLSNAVVHRLDGLLPRLTSRSDVPTVAESVINSRMMSYISSFSNLSGTGPVSAEVYSCSEIYLSMRMTVANAVGWYTSAAFHSDIALAFSDGLERTEQDWIGDVMRLGSWDWSPIVTTVLGDAQARPDVILCGDIHNITTISKSALINLNNVCLYSLFNAFSV